MSGKKRPKRKRKGRNVRSNSQPANDRFHKAQLGMSTRMGILSVGKGVAGDPVARDSPSWPRSNFKLATSVGVWRVGGCSPQCRLQSQLSWVFATWTSPTSRWAGVVVSLGLSQIRRFALHPHHPPSTIILRLQPYSHLLVLHQTSSTRASVLTKAR
jgi:hypothetical protein